MLIADELSYIVVACAGGVGFGSSGPIYLITSQRLAIPAPLTQEHKRKSK